MENLRQLLERNEKDGCLNENGVKTLAKMRNDEKAPTYEQLKEQNAELIRALKFYADETNWFTPNNSTVSAYRTLIDDKDIERFERKESHQSYAKRDVGGKLARSVLKALGV